MEELRGERLVLRPLAAEHTARLQEIREEPKVERWWGPLEHDFPHSDEPEATRYTILVEDLVAGMIQFNEENDPDYRQAEIDIFLTSSTHGDELGGEAIETLIRHLAEDRGHHRITISTETQNAVARRCYEKVGFELIGVARKCSRNLHTGVWVDEYWFDLLVGQPRKAAR